MKNNSISSRQRWNERYANLSLQRQTEPARFVTACLSRLPGRGQALDVAAGAGRHTLALVRRGLSVDAVDISAQGLRLAQQRVRTIPLAPGQHVHFIVADIERPWLPRRTYDVIVITRFLYRPLFPLLKACLTPGGWLIYETFLFEPKAKSNRRSMRREFLLEHEELKVAFSDFAILFYDEVKVDGLPVAQLLARKPTGA
jgi:tellurite methyltransferase